MLLAAGRGERLRPLTDSVPKAMVEVGGKPLLAWHLERLAAAGCAQAVINVSHLGDSIVERIGDGARFGLRVAYSRETERLETAGGIAQALHLLGTKPFLLVNADVYCDFDFRSLLAMRLKEKLAHLLLVPNPRHRPRGDFGLVSDEIKSNAGPRYTYAGIALVSPKLVQDVEPGEKAPLAPLLYQAADRGLMSGELYRGLWQDVGTRERLAELEAALKARHEHR